VTTPADSGDVDKANISVLFYSTLTNNKPMFTKHFYSNVIKFTRENLLLKLCEGTGNTIGLTV